MVLANAINARTATDSTVLTLHATVGVDVFVVAFIIFTLYSVSALFLGLLWPWELCIKFWIGLRLQRSGRRRVWYSGFLGPPTRLKSVLNSAARPMYHLRRSDHITGAPLERVQFKITGPTYKVLYGCHSMYSRRKNLGPFNIVAHLLGCRSLRSANMYLDHEWPFRLLAGKVNHLGI